MASIKTEKEHEFQHELALKELKDIWRCLKKIGTQVEDLTARVKELEAEAGVGDER